MSNIRQSTSEIYSVSEAMEAFLIIPSQKFQIISQGTHTHRRKKDNKMWKGN